MWVGIILGSGFFWGRSPPTLQPWFPVTHILPRSHFQPPQVAPTPVPRGAGAPPASSLLAPNFSVAGRGVPRGDGDTAAPAGPASAPPPPSKRSAGAAGEEVGAEPGAMSELERLRERDIPEGRQLLRDQHGNLHRVAEYCHSNYLQVRARTGPAEGLGWGRCPGQPCGVVPRGGW